MFSEGKKKIIPTIPLPPPPQKKKKSETDGNIEKD